MAKRGKDTEYEVGYGKPPRETRFQPGQSGNSKGRPPGAKNFGKALDEELRARVPVTENGRRRKLTKRQVIAKQLVNRAAEGDPKFMPLLLSEIRAREQETAQELSEEIFGGPEQQPVIDNIVERIRAGHPAPSPPSRKGEITPPHANEAQLDLPLEPASRPSPEKS